MLGWQARRSESSNVSGRFGLWAVALGISVSSFAGLGSVASPARAEANSVFETVHLAIRDRVLLTKTPFAVDRSYPIDDVILGYPVCGQGRTIADLAMTFVPNDNWAQLQLSMDGHVYTKTSSNGGRATVHSQGTTRTVGWQSFGFSAGGFGIAEAQAQASMSSTITGVSASGPLIRRIALRRAEQMRPQAQAEGARRAANTVKEHLRTRLEKVVATPNLIWQRTLAPFLTPRGVFPKQVASRTTAEWLVASLHFLPIGRNDQGQAAVAPMPAWPEGADLALQIPRAFGAAFVERALSGVEVTSGTLAKIWSVIGGEPGPTASAQGSRLQSVLFAADRPLDVTLVEGAFPVVRFTLRLDRVTLEGPAERADVSIEASYSVVGIGGEPKLVRRELRTSVQGLERDVDLLLPLELSLGGFAFPLESPGNGMAIERLNDLRLTTLTSSQDWVTIGLALNAL